MVRQEITVVKDQVKKYFPKGVKLSRAEFRRLFIEKYNAEYNRKGEDLFEPRHDTIGYQLDLLVKEGWLYREVTGEKSNKIKFARKD